MGCVTSWTDKNKKYIIKLKNQEVIVWVINKDIYRED